MSYNIRSISIKHSEYWNIRSDLINKLLSEKEENFLFRRQTLRIVNLESDIAHYRNFFAEDSCVGVLHVAI